MLDDELLDELELLPGSDELLELEDEELEEELLPGSDELLELEDDELLDEEELLEDELLEDEELDPPEQVPLKQLWPLLQQLVPHANCPGAHPQSPFGHGSHTPPVPTPGIAKGLHDSPGPQAAPKSNPEPSLNPHIVPPL